MAGFFPIHPGIGGGGGGGVNPNAITNATFNKDTNTITLTKQNGTQISLGLGELARLDEDNHFTGDNLFSELFLESKDTYVGDMNLYGSVAGGFKKTGRRDYTSHSHGNDGYVKSLLIRVSNGLGTGSTTSVNVWKVQKGADISQDVVTKIKDAVSFEIFEYKTGIKCVEVPINELYANETYFIYQIIPSSHMAYVNITREEDAIYIGDNDDVTPTTIEANKNATTIGVYGIIGRDINVRDMLASISNDFVQDITFDTTTNTLKKTKNGTETNVIDHVVTRWKDLEHVNEYETPNLIDYDKRVKGYWYTNNGNNGIPVANNSWSIYELKVKPSTQYTIQRKANDSSLFIYYNDDNFVSVQTPNRVHTNGWHTHLLDVPADVNKVGICFQHGMNDKTSLMAIERDQAIATFIPYGGNIQVGHEVSLKFDNSDCDIKSTTVSDAIKELSLKSEDIDWKDLSYVEQYKYINLMDYNKRINGKWYDDDSGVMKSNASWSVYELDVVESNQYSILRKRNDSARYVYFNDITHVLTEVATNASINEWNRQTITIPQGANKVHFCFQHGMNPVGDIMVLEGEITEAVDFIPYISEPVNVLVGTEVGYKFNNANTNLQSTTLANAIRELDIKITNAGGTVNSVNNQLPDTQGNVTLDIQHITGLQAQLDEKVPKSDLTTMPQPNKVPQLNQQGKIELALLPDLSINKVHSVADKQEAIDLINNQTASVGDIFILRDNNNSVHMYVNENGNTFDDKCVELTVSNGTVKTVNNLAPNATGNVTVTSTDIEYDNVISGLVAQNVKDAIDELNTNIKNSYSNSTYDVQTGRLTLIKDNGQQVPYDLATGTVKTVNGQPSNPQGNVTVNSEHINYDSQTSGLTSTTVQDAIDELNRKFVSDVRYESADRSLHRTIDGQEQELVSGLVTRWTDLDHVQEYTHTNVLDYSKVIPNKAIDGSGEHINASADWGTIEFPVTANEDYTLLRQRNANVKIRFEDNNGSKVGFINDPAPASNGWHRCKFTIPSGATKGILEVRVTQGNEYQTMIFLGDQLNLSVDTNNPISFADGQLIQVGSEVSLKFDNSNSTLKSTTVNSAIKELNDKIANAGSGTVTSVNGEIPVGGNVTLTSQVTQTVGQDIVLAVGNQNNFATLQCMTAQEVQEIIALFV